MRCDLIAEGILQAIKEVGVEVPIVVRLEGNSAKKGLQLLADSGQAVITASDLNDAAAKAIAAAA